MFWLLLLWFLLPSPHHPHNLEHLQDSKDIPFSPRAVHSRFHVVHLLQTACWAFIYMPDIENQSHHLAFFIQSSSSGGTFCHIHNSNIALLLHLSCSIHMATSQTTLSLLSLFQLLNTGSPRVMPKIHLHHSPMLTH